MQVGIFPRRWIAQRGLRSERFSGPIYLQLFPCGSLVAYGRVSYGSPTGSLASLYAGPAGSASLGGPATSYSAMALVASVERCARMAEQAGDEFGHMAGWINKESVGIYAASRSLAAVPRPDRRHRSAFRSRIMSNATIISTAKA